MLVELKNVRCNGRWVCCYPGEHCYFATCATHAQLPIRYLEAGGGPQCIQQLPFGIGCCRAEHTRCSHVLEPYRLAMDLHGAEELIATGEASEVVRDADVNGLRRILCDDLREDLGQLPSAVLWSIADVPQVRTCVRISGDRILEPHGLCIGFGIAGIMIRDGDRIGTGIGGACGGDHR